MHVDGYVGYNGLLDVTLVGCWALARRKFDEALKTLPIEKRGAAVTAKEGWISTTDSIEHELREATPEERYAVRQERFAGSSFSTAKIPEPQSVT